MERLEEEMFLVQGDVHGLQYTVQETIEIVSCISSNLLLKRKPLLPLKLRQHTHHIPNYPKIASLMALKAYNVMNLPGGAAVSHFFTDLTIDKYCAYLVCAL